MKTVIVGTTDSIINLNKSGVPIVGKTPTVVDINTAEKETEIRVLVRNGLIRIIDEPEDMDNSQNDKEEHTDEKQDKIEKTEEKIQNIPKKRGRPKNPKNVAELAQIEKERVQKAEAETQKMGAKVIVATGDGVKEGKMRRSFVDELPESDKARASIEAMQKIKQEEGKAVLPENPVPDKKLDPSEQMGRKAIVSSAQGEKEVDMKNSLLPNADESKNRDPFIDKQDDGYDDAFIKI